MPRELLYRKTCGRWLEEKALLWNCVVSSLCFQHTVYGDSGVSPSCQAHLLRWAQTWSNEQEGGREKVSEELPPPEGVPSVSAVQRWHVGPFLSFISVSHSLSVPAFIIPPLLPIKCQRWEQILFNLMHSLWRCALWWLLDTEPADEMFSSWGIFFSVLVVSKKWML